MKKLKLLLAFCALFLIGGGNFANAQITDVTSTYLVNPSFETLKASDGTTDVTVKTTLSSGLYGWIIDNSSMSNYQVESAASGSSSGFVNGGSINPTEGTYYYFNRKGWGNLNTTLSTTTKTKVEPGTYYVVFDYKAADYSNLDRPQNNGTTIGITVKDASDATLATLPAVKRAYSIANNGSNPGTDSYMKDARWCKMGVAFTVETASAITISVQQNMVNSGRSDIVYDNFKLYKIGESQEIDFSGYIANPFFETANNNAWTQNGGAVRRGGYEIWHVNNAKVYQTVNGLLNGKYRVSMQVLHGEGEKANSLLYAKVGETETTTQATGETETTGGSAFGHETDRITADADLGKISAEIEVTNGSLELGFKQTTSSQWDVFSNFTLTYIDPAVSALAFELPDGGAMVAGQWYKYVVANTAEYTVSAATAEDIKVTEDVLLSEYTGTAIEAGAHVNLTAGTYYFKSTSDNTLTITLNDPRIPARLSLMDKINEVATARKESNEGVGAFQIPISAGTTLASAKSTAQGVYDNGDATLEEITTATSTLNTAIETYNATTLNAPNAEKHYNIIVASTGHTKENNAVVEILGATGANNPTGYSFNASATPNVNYAQAVKFTQVSGNNYNISFETSEGVVYLTYGALNGSAAGWKNSQIQGTTDSAKKGEFKIAATATANVFNIYNTITNSTIACQDGGALYTEAGNADFTIAEASQATVDMTIDENVKYATRIFPFTPVLPSGVVAYSCESADGDVLNLGDPVATPAANTPYILYAENGYTGDALTGWGTAAATTVTAGLLTGVYVETPAPVGSYVLQNNSKVGFYVVAEGKQPTVGANRCYLTDGNTARSAFFFGGNITGVDNVEAASEATLKDGKYLENGKIVIVKNGVKYNAAGAKLY